MPFARTRASPDGLKRRHDAWAPSSQARACNLLGAQPHSHGDMARLHAASRRANRLADIFWRQMAVITQDGTQYGAVEPFCARPSHHFPAEQRIRRGWFRFACNSEALLHPVDGIRGRHTPGAAGPLWQLLG